MLQASDGGSLPVMPTVSDTGLQIGPAKPQDVPPVVAQRLSKSRRAHRQRNNLHSGPEVSLEAVPFNSKASAIPLNHSPHSTAPVSMDTANTSLLRWA